MNRNLWIMATIRAWLMQIIVAGFNFFVLMNLIYQPLWGELVAHQIGMATRIIINLVFAYLLLLHLPDYKDQDLIWMGILWFLLTLVFEWAGSLSLGRPVNEILVGWNIAAGYWWPYVLLSYLLSPYLVGKILKPGRTQ
ncbi:MAG: hypothetical protein QM405_03805 [Euryarchaeota archaeon]|jgi:hypothetical protein|nr:hypothetical protein [Euryarchaeota archaeon]